MALPGYGRPPGVEDEVVRARLVAMGCGHAQGYLFSRPLPAAELSAWLDAHRRPVADTVVSLSVS